MAVEKTPAQAKTLAGSCNPVAKEWYWVPHPTRVWIMVFVKRIEGDSCWVSTSDSLTEFELSLTECPFLKLNPRVVDDMATLMHLHEAGILHNLYERANPQNQFPYTYVSTVLIALNPLRQVPMPSMEVTCNETIVILLINTVQTYKDMPLGAAPPNPYGIAELAFQNLTAVRNKKIRNQSIVISGESGAGKTETAKIVLRYLCWRAGGRALSNVGQERVSGGNDVALDKKLLDTNPILEAFGNAKTFRNSNSSRFGKLLKLNFKSDLNYGLVSASIDTYLLEKSRVALFPVGERNYHVFYQLLLGASSSERKRWHLRDINHYAYLNFGHSKDIEDVDDKMNFSTLTSGLLSVGISMPQQDLLFRVLAAILCLGNITFETVEESSGESAEVEDPKLLSRVAELLGVRVQHLESTLTSRSLDMSAASGRTSSYRIPLDVKQASYARDAVAKTMYETTFHWIIDQIRKSFCPEESPSHSHYIGVLDIFGFESFERNGLEQLLINYANESLQLIFNKAVLDAEQEMYLEEGFMMDPIEYTNNNECVQLIATGRDAILTTLDAVCKAPEPSEDKFNSLIHKTHSKNSHFLKPEMKNMRTTFKIKHYAKAVQYTVGTFVPKNMDSCPPELFELMASSSHSSKCSLFGFDPEIEDEIREGLIDREDLIRNIHSEGKPRRTPAAPPPRRQNYTVGKKFKIQMTSLSELLSSTSCAFVRCIKPNASMTPGLFEHAFVMDQVRSLGVVETCDVLRQGLPSRVQFAEIEAIYRLHFVGAHAMLIKNLTGRQFTEAILWALNVDKSAYKLGKSRVFFDINSLSDMNRVLNSYTEKDELNLVVKRVIRFINYKRWRRVFIAGFSFSVWLHHLEQTRTRICCCTRIQRKWRSYVLSTLRSRRIRARKLWKVAIFYTVGCQVLLSNYRLICESRAMREQAEREAQKLLEESQAEEIRQQKLIDEMALKTGVDTNAATKSCARKFRSTLNFGQRNSTLLQDDSHDDMSFEENKELEDALMEQQKSQSKSEMKRLAAASSLATVSVTLFRWTKIKKFRAFEKWFEVYKSGVGMTRSPEAKYAYIGQGKRPEEEIATIESLALEHGKFQCFECRDRVAKVWCYDCNQPYCLVCSQFVHSSCTIMRYHRPMSIDTMPSPDNIALLRTPVEPLSSFVAAGTVKAMVTAVLHSECDLQNGKSSLSKMLYYSKANTQYHLEGIGNHSSLLLDRVYGLDDPQSLVENTADKGERQLVFSGSGGLVHGDDEQHCAIRSCDQPASMGISIRFCTAHYEEFRSATRSLSVSDDNRSVTEGEATLQQQVALLKKQLLDSGQQPVEFVELSVARAMMQEAVERLMSGDEKAEADVEKWDKAIRLNPEYQKELLEKAAKWEADERASNLACLKKMRGLVPLEVRQMSASAMEEKGLPKKIAQRIWSKKILWFVCTHPDDIGKIHVADLRTKYSYIGMDIVEMRAVYAALPQAFENDGDGKKKEWRDAYRQKLEELTVKEANNRLTNPEKRNFAYKGNEDLSLFDPDVPIQRAELLKSDAFGPTDMSDVEALTGVGGVKEKQSRMANRSSVATSGQNGSETAETIRTDGDSEHIENRGSHEKAQAKSRLIAESALAADELKRAEARGSLIAPMSNPLVNQKELASLRRPENSGNTSGTEEEGEDETAGSSALDGGIQSIQQTILKMELAKKHKDEKSKTDEDKERHFTDQFIAKGLRPSADGKPRGGRGRGRGHRSSVASAPRGSNLSPRTTLDTTSTTRVTDSKLSLSEDWSFNDSFVKSTEESMSIEQTEREAHKGVITADASSDAPQNELIGTSNSQDQLPDEEEATIEESIETFEEKVSSSDIVEVDSFTQCSVNSQPETSKPHPDSPPENHIECREDPVVEVVPSSTQQVETASVSTAGFEEDEEFSKIVIKKKEKSEPPKKKPGLWGLMKKKI